MNQICTPTRSGVIETNPKTSAKTLGRKSQLRFWLKVGKKSILPLSRPSKYTSQFISGSFRFTTWELWPVLQVSRLKLSENSKFLGFKRIWKADHAKKWSFCQFLVKKRHFLLFIVKNSKFRDRHIVSLPILLWEVS